MILDEVQDVGIQRFRAIQQYLRLHHSRRALRLARRCWPHRVEILPRRQQPREPERPSTHLVPQRQRHAARSQLVVGATCVLLDRRESGKQTRLRLHSARSRRWEESWEWPLFGFDDCVRSPGVPGLQPAAEAEIRGHHSVLRFDGDTARPPAQAECRVAGGREIIPARPEHT